MKSVLVIILFLFSINLHAKDFSLHTIDGHTIHIEKLEGNLIFKDKTYAKKPVLFFFFGTRCPFCEREIPQVAKLYNQKKLQVIGVQAQLSVTDERLEEFAHEEDMDFEILTAKDANKLVHYLQKRKLWIGGVPYYVLVDKYGNLEPTDLDTILESIDF